jgi:hypothetical protein
MISTLREVFEGFVFDPSLIDLVVWYPYLSWQELFTWAATVLVWRFVFERFERFAAYHSRRVLSWGLFRLAVLVKP